MAPKERSKQDIDGGYAWVIFASSFIMYVLAVGSKKCYGVLYAEMLDYFQATVGETSWIGSLQFSLSFAVAPFANNLCLRTSFRSVTFVGGFCIGIGFITSALVPSVSLLYLTFGVIAGLGYGLCTTSCFTLLAMYFERRRALVCGLVSTGSTVGFLIFPYLYRYLFETFGLRGAFLLLGGVMLNVCCMACCFRQPSILDAMETARRSMPTEHGGDQETGRGDNSSVPEQGRCSSWIPDFKLSLFKQFKFTIFTLGTILGVVAYVSCIILIPVYVRELGYSKTLANVAISICGCSEIVGRIAIGVMIDKLSFTPSKVVAVSMLIGTPFVFLTPFLPYFTYVATFAAVVGLLPGVVMSLHPLIVIEATGIDDFPQGIGILAFGNGVGLLVSQRVLGWSHDLTGSWDAAFMISAVLMLVSAVCLLVPHIKRNPKSSSQPATYNVSAPTTDLDLQMNEQPSSQIETHM